MNVNFSIAVRGKSLVLYDKTKKDFYFQDVASFFKGNKHHFEKILVCNKQDFINKKLISKKNTHFIDIFEIVAFLFPTETIGFNVFSIFNFLSGENKEKPKDLKKILEEEVLLIFSILNLLKDFIKKLPLAKQQEIYSLAFFMKQEEWEFSDFILENLDKKAKTEQKYVNVWEIFKPFREKILEDKIDNNLPVTNIKNKDVETKLDQITAEFSNKRKKQKDYALFVKDMFIFDEKFDYNFIFAEAGTGIGKTLGYISGVLSFVKKNPNHQVLISTYSKVLQKQIQNELSRSIENKQKFEETVAIIKGSSNYVCLLNYQSLINNSEIFPFSKVFIGIMARWLLSYEGGDLIGGMINSMIFEISDYFLVNFILNQRDECTFSRCKFYNKCFVMKAKYKASLANIVISNHSYSMLSLHNNSMNPKYIVFDEAHHLFSTADEVFSGVLNLRSTFRLKYWIQGSNNRAATMRSELNGFKSRLDGFITNDSSKEEEQIINLTLTSLLESLITLANIFPNENAIERIVNHMPKGLVEEFLYHTYLYVLNANDDLNNYYTIEAEIFVDNLSEKFKQAKGKLYQDLARMLNMSNQIYNNLMQKLTYVENEDIKSLEEIIRNFEGRCIDEVTEYLNMLREIEELDDNFIYKMVIEKEEGRIVDISYCKNYLDPMIPFATEILSKTKGVTFTSATLSDNSAIGKDIERLRNKFGLQYLENIYIDSIYLPSLFNYEQNSQILIITDNFKSNINDLSLAIQELFKASNGGGLAIFTAINRLKQVYKNININLIEENIPLIAQHINKQKMSNLVDIFKEEINSSMLGTDSARDGVDVPGDSLRMVVFEKVPWSKPDILLKKRSAYFTESYRNDLVIKKLRQGFGRLIRKEEDKGIFIMLDKAMPSAFLKSFPSDVKVSKVNLNEAIIIIKEFFKGQKC